MNKVAKFSIGSIIAGVLAFLSVHFNIAPKDDVGAGILALLGYLAAAITHSGSKPQPPAQIFKALLLPFLLLAPSVLHAQRPTMRAQISATNAAADSSHFKLEIGSDLNVAQSGDSMPADVRLGFLVGSTFTIEPAIAAQQDSGYVEADVRIAVTAALFPGTTNTHGNYVFAAPAFHYEAGESQFAAIIGTGMRALATNGFAARTEAFTEVRFARGSLPSRTVIGARIGVSFWR